jgi:chromosome segregation ATPase
MMGDRASTPELLLKALLERWPHLTTAIDSWTFSPDTNPGPLIQTTTAQDGPDKARFVAMLDGLEEKTKQLIAQHAQVVEEYDADLTRAEKRTSDLDALVATQQNEVDKVKQALEQARAEIAGLNSKITDLNTHQSMENTRIAEYNRHISKLQVEKAELQTRLLQATTTNGASIQLEKTSKP